MAISSLRAATDRNVTGALGRDAGSRPHRVLRLGGVVQLLGAAAVSAIVFTFAAPAAATNSTLRTSIGTWSTRLGRDARSVALAAKQRHPGAMTNRAIRFRLDALAARAAVRRQRATTAKGARARRMAIVAFANYASAGAAWASSGRARFARRVPAATALAQRASRYARTGNSLLIAAGKLLR